MLRRFFLGFGVFLLAMSVAWAGLPAPTLMPGFPMVVGPNVMVMWQPVPGAVKYNVYVNGKKVGETPAVNHMIPAPQDGGTYTIEVEPVDATGAAGERASGKVVIVKLEPPEGLVARPTTTRVTLRWDVAKGAILYNVYRADSPDAPPNLLGSVQNTKYVDGKVEPGKTYYYRVTARDASGVESKPGDVVEVKVPEKQAEGLAGEVEEIFLPVSEYKCNDQGFGFPGDMALSPDGDTLYVVDERMAKVHLIDPDTLEVRATWPPEGAPYRLNGVLGLGVDPSGDPIYLSAGNRLLAVSPSGALVWERDLLPMADAAAKAGILPRPMKAGASDIAVDPETGELYLANSAAKMIVITSPDATEVLRGIDLSDRMGVVASVSFTPKGTLVCTDSLAAKVFELDKKGNTVASFGKFGVIPGSIGRANGVVMYAPDKVVVTDTMATKLHVFQMDGTYLGNFAKDGKPVPNISSYYVAFDPSGQRFFWSGKLQHEVCVVRVETLP
ncbi:hypothetical protein [Deferrisoma camini]|uniref:hypothetical protein n=1 Tax=Deferrisoma camini TaxID=1035120 RepID=UPI0004AD0633|nr:hypothetical protein [Deferrisoma camini]